MRHKTWFEYMKRFSPKISYKKHVHIMMRKLLCTLKRVNLR